MKALQTPLTRQKSLHARAVHEIREMIISGHLKPGDRLLEIDLCEKFGISRTPLREALKILETEGLVDLRRNRGALVAAMTPHEVTELFEFVSNIERVAVELAIERMEAKHLRRLQNMHDKMMRFYNEGRRRECFQTDYEIHTFIVSLAGNSILTETHKGLMARTRRGRYMALFSQVRWDEAMEEHEEIMAAINRHDVKNAGDVMRTHVKQTGTVIRESLHPGKGDAIQDAGGLSA